MGASGPPALIRSLIAAVWLCSGGLSQSLPEKAVATLAENCRACHSDSMQMSELRLTSREALLKGGKRGPAIIPGNPANSRLFQFISRNAQPNMPPGKPLPPEVVETIRKWIEAGAEWPSPSKAGASPAASWWAFKTPVPVPPPVMANPWIRTAIDRFILSKIAEQNLQPSPEANRATLIRRAYLDLTGLPPTSTEVEAFAGDPATDAYERLVDRLLDSPRYGEKWGRLWLDLVRYSDTSGFELDSYISDAWRYRDWVIESLNKDKPYDRFVKEQIAGDEIWPDDPIAKTGTGYFCIGPNMDIYADQQDINRVQTLTDYVDTTSSVFLGLTVACARCHDHKFDPIPQRDYYRLQSIFEPAIKTTISLGKLPGLSYKVSENTREVKLQEIADEIGAVESRCRGELRKNRQKDDATAENRASNDELRACLNPAESAAMQRIERELVSMFSSYKPKPFVCGVREASRVYPATHVPARGGGDGPAVTPGFLSALGGGDVPDPPEAAKTTGRRKALAEWIASPANPLTARVLVNRVWQGHFGRGLVATSSDYGARGTKPSHPELLDWLTVKFVEGGWSWKRLHRLIMTSAVYRQASAASTDSRSRDPENVWLSHFDRRRLTAEEIRDSILQGAGALNLKMYGRPVVPRLSDTELFGLTGKANEKWIVTADERESGRRSIYLFNRRTYRLPMLEVFDAPETVVTCPRRESSTTSTQSLTLLNSEFMMASASRLGASVSAANPSDSTMAAAVWRSILARSPSSGELRKAVDFLTRQKENLGSRPAAASELVRAVFNLNEFLYVD